MSALHSRPLGKALAFSGRGGGEGGGKVQYLLVGGLVVVILGSAALLVRGLMGPSGPRSSGDIVFLCEKCGYQFTRSAKELQAEASPSGHPSPADEIKMIRQDCPKCGAKGSAWQCVKCYNPSCGKYFISQSRRAKALAMQGGRSMGGPDGIRDVCPYCKMDWLEGYQKYGPK